jgi:hypothetical protein
LYPGFARYRAQEQSRRLACFAFPHQSPFFTVMDTPYTTTPARRLKQAPRAHLQALQCTPPPPAFFGVQRVTNRPAPFLVSDTCRYAQPVYFWCTGESGTHARPACPLGPPGCPRSAALGVMVAIIRRMCTHGD